MIKIKSVFFVFFIIAFIGPKNLIAGSLCPQPLQPNQTLPLPDGSYKHSCTGCWTNVENSPAAPGLRCVLYCYPCNFRDHQQSSSTSIIDYTDCNADIMNCDTTLVCGNSCPQDEKIKRMK